MALLSTESIVRAYFDGARRVLRAPAVWFGAWLVTLAVGFPLALVLRRLIADHLGGSLAAEPAAGVNWEWWQEFQRQATGLGATFGPSVLGFASVLRHISDLLDNAALAPVLAGAVGAWLIVWSFLSGGMLDRYARNRQTWASGFFAACGTHFFRLARLGVVAVAAYYAIFAWVSPFVFEELWDRLTRDLDVERTAFMLAASMYVVLGVLLLAVSILFDYARVRIVVEDRRSALGALAASLRFVRRHPGKVASLYAVNTFAFLVLAGFYALVAPGAWGPGPWQWVAFAIGQAWILARVWVKLTFYASAISLFQRELAHADYVATAIPEWPESPAVEAIRGEPPTAAVP
jgi:hypothetical protein